MLVAPVVQPSSMSGRVQAVLARGRVLGASPMRHRLQQVPAHIGNPVAAGSHRAPFLRSGDMPEPRRQGSWESSPVCKDCKGAEAGAESLWCLALPRRRFGSLDELAEGLVLGQWQEQPKPSPRTKQLHPPRGLGSVSPTLCPAKLPPTAEVSHSGFTQQLPAAFMHSHGQ